MLPPQAVLCSIGMQIPKTPLTLVNRGCQMALAKFLDCICLALQALKDYGSATVRCKISSLPFLAPHTLQPGQIQGKEGIKFCHLATLWSISIFIHSGARGRYAFPKTAKMVEEAAPRHNQINITHGNLCKGPCFNDVDKIFVFFDPLLSSFGTYLQYRIQATSLTLSAF